MSLPTSLSSLMWAFPTVLCRFDLTSIAVQSYYGWGVKGTNILFTPVGAFVSDKPPLASLMEPSQQPITGLLPATSLPEGKATGTHPSPPVQASYVAPSQQTPPPSSPTSMDNHNDRWKLIVGVTVGIGGCLILAAVAMAFMWPVFIARR